MNAGRKHSPTGAVTSTAAFRARAVAARPQSARASAASAATEYGRGQSGHVGAFQQPGQRPGARCRGEPSPGLARFAAEPYLRRSARETLAHRPAQGLAHGLGCDHRSGARRDTGGQQVGGERQLPGRLTRVGLLRTHGGRPAQPPPPQTRRDDQSDRGAYRSPDQHPAGTPDAEQGQPPPCELPPLEPRALGPGLRCGQQLA